MEHRTYITLQTRVADWAIRMFGDNHPWRLVAGIVEEAGEFTDAESHGDQMDALGDIAIYSMNLCAKLGWQYQDFWQRACITMPSPRRNLLAYLGEMERAVLKRDQGIRGYDKQEVFESAMRRGLEGTTWYTVTWWQASAPGIGRKLSAHLPYLAQVVDKVCSRDWLAHPLDANLHEGAAEVPLGTPCLIHGTLPGPDEPCWQCENARVGV